MAIIRGKAAIKGYDEQVAQRAADRENKVAWLALKDGEKVDLIFLQEMDEDSERYSEKNGLGFLVEEHNNPSQAQFFKRVMCTADSEEHDNQCWACEKNRAEWAKSTEQNKYNGGWGKKTNLYINVLVRPEDGDEYVAVLQRKRSEESFTEDILEHAFEDGFISNRLCTLQRKGSGLKTKYRLTFKNEDAGINVEDYEVFDLEKLVREVAYEKQAEALGFAEAPSRPTRSVEDEGNSNPEDDDDDWL